MPRAEFDVTIALVKDLLQHQFPELVKDRELRPFTNGWDNVMMRLGDDLVVRLPRRQLAVELIEHEQQWLPLLARQMTAAVPVPIAVGAPTAAYPANWSVQAWIEGQPLAAPHRNAAALHPVLAGDGAGRAAIATDLGAFLAALHLPAPVQVWRSPYRGGSLAERAELVRERASDQRHGNRLLQHFTTALGVEIERPNLWVHGDLHPLNVLHHDNRLAAVIDWGDLTQGDPACDLAVAWLGFQADDAQQLRSTYDRLARHHLELRPLWQRARGWAVHLALVMATQSDDHPELAAIGRHALRRLAAE